MANSNYDEVHVVSDSEDDYEEEVWNGSYHASFPNEWIITHIEGTGPEECLNCADYGSYKGQFIGYCANCAQYPYYGQRGRGFMGNGIELVDEQTRRWASAYETYLSHVEFARFTDEFPSVFDEEDEQEEDSRSQDSDDSSMPDLIDAGQETVFDARFEGGYADF